MGWKVLLPQPIREEGRKLLEDAGHTIIDGRGFETEDVLADMKEFQPEAMIVRIVPITREVIEANPNLRVVVRHGTGYDTLDVQACHDNGVQALYAPIANSTSVAETAMLLMLECSRNRRQGYPVRSRNRRQGYPVRSRNRRQGYPVRSRNRRQSRRLRADIPERV